MICKCSGCRRYFEATGVHALEVITGGKTCPQCGGLIDRIVAEAGP